MNHGAPTENTIRPVKKRNKLTINKGSLGEMVASLPSSCLLEKLRLTPRALPANHRDPASLELASVELAWHLLSALVVQSERFYDILL